MQETVEQRKLKDFDKLVKIAEEERKNEDGKTETVEVQPIRSSLLRVLRSGEYHDEDGVVSIFDERRGSIKHDHKIVERILMGDEDYDQRDYLECHVDDDYFEDEEEKREWEEEMKKEREKEREILNKNKTFYDGAIGCIVGMAIADAMGQRCEHKAFMYSGNKGRDRLRDMGHDPDGRFMLKPGQWTDETSLALCLADSLLIKEGIVKPHDIMHRFLAWHYLGYNNAFHFDECRMDKRSFGAEGTLLCSLESYVDSPEPEAVCEGDTSEGVPLARNAAIPICFHDDVKLACDSAAQQSRTTHSSVETADCCRLLTLLVIRLLESRSKECSIREVLDRAGTEFCTLFPDCVESVKCLARGESEDASNPDRNWTWKSSVFSCSPSRLAKDPKHFGSYVMDALSLALHVIYHSSSFEEAILRVVNMQGESCVVGAIAGQMAGAWYGISAMPKAWVKSLRKWDHDEIALRGFMLARCNEGLSCIFNEHDKFEAFMEEATERLRKWTEFLNNL